jgi:hypothetical protein
MLFFLFKSFPVFVLVFLSKNRSAHPATAGPENVQCRSVFIQFMRALVRQHLSQHGKKVFVPNFSFSG